MAGSAEISDRAQTCAGLFHQILSAISGRERIDSDPELSAQIDDQLGRFSIWAGNIGVFAQATASLDYRVRDIPQIKDLIVQQLDGLVKYLKHAINITRHEAWRTPLQLEDAIENEGDGAGTSISPAPPSSSSSELSEIQLEFCTPSPLKQGIDDIEKTITRLYRLSVAIRKSATQIRKMKAASYVDRDENGHDLTSEFENFATRLIRLKYPDVSQELCQRLGYANALRRRQFLYRQRHQQKLSLGSSNRILDKVTESRPGLGPLVLTPRNGDDGESISREMRPSPSPVLGQDGKSALLSETMATALELRSFRPGDALSRVSTAITAAPLHGSFDVPPPPRITARAKEFQCPYCCLMLPVEVASIARWRASHHVKKDLEPYICMFEECAEPYTLFATRDAWLSHMQWEHTLQWRCNAPGHLPQYFAKEQDFDDHLRSSHAGTFTESQLPLLKRRSAQPAPKTFLSCPLCGHPPAESPDGITSGTCLEELPNHIAAHLQSIAVMSLPWREDLEEGWANPRGPTEWDPERVPSSLHECERFGLTPIIPELLKAGSDVDSQEATKIGPSPKDHALGKQSQPRVVTSTEEEFESPVIKDILRPPRDKFPVREGVAPLKDAGKKGIPPGARWTKIARKLVNPEALEMGGERYEERVDHVIVLRVLTAEEIQRYAAETQEIRARRLFPSSPL